MRVQATDPVTPNGRQQLRSLIGAMQCPAAQRIWFIAAAASYLQAAVDEATVGYLLEVLADIFGP